MTTFALASATAPNPSYEQLRADRVLDDLTRTPMILAEVVSLFQAGKKIPSSRFGVLGRRDADDGEFGDPSDRSRKCSAFGFRTCLPGEARKFSGDGRWRSTRRSGSSPRG